MILTIEDVIKQETLLDGFVPFVEIAIQVKQLSFNRQIAFFCSCYERILPIYMLVNGAYGWGDISILYSVRDNLWEIASGIDISQGMIANSISRANEIFVECNDDNSDDERELREGLYIYFGEEVFEICNLILEYVERNENNVYFKIFVQIIYIMYEYAAMYFGNISSDLNWLSITKLNQLGFTVMNNSLMQAELNKELADLEFLKNTSELTPEILSIFRSNACPNGVGILGSLDKVRANLEGI